jgi:hypothetical protein
MYVLLKVNELYIVQHAQFTGNISTFRLPALGLYTFCLLHCKIRQHLNFHIWPILQTMKCIFLTLSDFPKVKFKYSFILHMHYAKCTHS